MIDLLVTGASGTLGSVVLRAALQAGWAAWGTVVPGGAGPAGARCSPLQLLDEAALDAIVDQVQPRTLLHLAAISSPAQAAAEPGVARAVNVDATIRLARAAARHGARFVFSSSDLVFDGEHAPYAERAPARPCCTYGRLKREAEDAVLEAGGVVVRLPWLYGLPSVHRAIPPFFVGLLRALRQGRELRLFVDEYRTPLWTEDAASALLRVAASDCAGVLHLAGPQRLSRYQVGELTAAALGVSSATLVPTRRAEMELSEPRPHDCSLSAERYHTLFEQPPGRAMSQALPLILRDQRAA